MREILFRGKNKYGKWYYGYYTEGYYLDGTPVSWIEVVDRKKKETDSPTVIPETVGQFTGLTDKNGKKIFEGDILQSWSDYHKNYYYQGVVRYGEFNCSCCDGVYGWYLDGGDIRNIDSYEVCGNIHDNPELLGGAGGG